MLQLGAASKFKINASECMRLIDELAESWKDFSEHSGFPVPGPDADYGLDMTAEEYYEQKALRSQLWDKNQPYGKLRWELLDHCIASLESQL